MASRTLLVLPDATVDPLVALVAAARTTIRLKMFVFTDPSLLGAVIEARKRGVDVRVMLNAARRSGESDNDESRKTLEAAGVTVKDSNPTFDLTHEKSLVVDDNLAAVMSLNWETRNVTETRDYAVVTDHRKEVVEVLECFDADWNRTAFVPHDGSHLIWCNANGRERFAHFIDGAQSELWLQNERYQDAVIIERVVRAAGRGVKVNVLARAPHTLKKDKLVEGVGGLRILHDVGCKVHRMKGMKLHGKMMLADGARAVIGSVNLAPGSFDARRELAIEVKDPAVIEPLERVVRRDWEHSVPLDLSDAGLMADLAKRGAAADASVLVLDGPGTGSKKKHKH